MGKPTTTAEDVAIALLAGTFTGAGQSGTIVCAGWSNLSFYGAFSATSLAVTLQKSYDGGTNWMNVARDASGALAQWTTFTTAGFSVQFFEPEDGVLYRLDTSGSAFTGTLTYRISR